MDTCVDNLKWTGENFLSHKRPSALPTTLSNLSSWSNLLKVNFGHSECPPLDSNANLVQASIVLRVERDEGKGRTLVFLHEERCSFSSEALAHLSARNRLIHLVTEDVTPQNWEELSNAVSKVFEERELRQVSFVCLEHASVIALHRSLDEGKFVRSLVLYHPICSPHPNAISRAVEWIEEKLPLGLPLRALQAGFHAPSFLHRVRCPTVILLKDSATEYVREQAHKLSHSIPTAWLVSMSDQDILEKTIGTIVEEMAEVPVKCPQKNESIQQKQRNTGAMLERTGINR